MAAYHFHRSERERERASPFDSFFAPLPQFFVCDIEIDLAGMGFPHKSDLWDDDGKLLSRCKNSCPLDERIMEFAREASSFARLYLSFKENKDGRDRKR